MTERGAYLNTHTQVLRKDMGLPPGELVGMTQTKVFLHVARNPGCSLREAMAAAGIRSLSTGTFHLRLLRERGLVDWEPGKTRTLRATTRVVA